MITGGGGGGGKTTGAWQQPGSQVGAHICIVHVSGHVGGGGGGGGSRGGGGITGPGS